MVQLIQVERKNFNSYLSTFSFSGRRSSLPFLILELRLGCIFEHTSSSDPADFLHQLIWRVGQEVDHLMYVMHPILQTTPRVLGFIPGAVNTPQWRNSRVEGLDVCKFRRRAGCPVCDLSVCIWNINSRREKNDLSKIFFIIIAQSSNNTASSQLADEQIVIAKEGLRVNNVE